MSNVRHIQAVILDGKGLLLLTDEDGVELHPTHEDEQAVTVKGMTEVLQVETDVVEHVILISLFDTLCPYLSQHTKKDSAFAESF